MKRNIYKLDDICLIISWILLVILIIRSLILIPELLTGFIAGRKDFSRPLLFIGIFSASFLFLQVVGRTVRTRERRLQKIIDVILHYRSINTANLSRVTGISRAQLDIDLGEIEKHSRPHILVQGEQISLQTGERVKVPYICLSCGVSSAGEIYINSPLLTCSYCGTPLEDTEVRKLREKLLQKARATSKALQEDKPLNIPLLIILFMFFWPGAIIYLVKYSMNKNKNNVLFEEVRKNFELS